MFEVMEALDGHVHHNGTEVEIQLLGGSWDDVRRLVTPFADAWTTIGVLCNGLALDSGEEDAALGYEAGRSILSHEILRIMAAAERKVQSR